MRSMRRRFLRKIVVGPILWQQSSQLILKIIWEEDTALDQQYDGCCYTTSYVAPIGVDTE